MTGTATTGTTALLELTRWRTGGAELAYTDSGGDGDAVLLMHGGGLAGWFTPLAATGALAHHRVIRLIRAGYTGAPAPAGLSIAGHAAHAAALLRHLGAAPAHVVAHSSSSTIALQLAVDDPGLVRTLTLCEPPLVEALADPADHDLLRTAMGPTIGAVMGAAGRGDLPAAFDMFMTLACGPDHRTVMAGVLGADAVEDAARHCGFFFTGEMPAVAAWSLPPAAAGQLHLPVLLVQGEASPAPVHRLIAHLAGLLPDARIATVRGANHLLPLTHPAVVARMLAEFCRSA